MREFLAFPFLMGAKAFAVIASFIDTEEVLCISMRDCIELTDETMEEILKDLEDDK